MQNFETKIHEILDVILKDYQNDRTIDKIKNFDLPDNAVLEEILHSLKKIIFPGYFRNHSVKIYTVRNQTSMLLEDVIYKLSNRLQLCCDMTRFMKSHRKLK